MNDDALCLTDRVVWVAGKRAPTVGLALDLVGASLLAMNDDAVCLTDRVVCIAGKRAPTVGLGACDLAGDER